MRQSFLDKYTLRNWKKPQKKRRKVWKTLGIITAIFIGAGLLLTIGVFAFFAKDLPDPGKINKRFIIESTKIYDRTGDHLLYEIHGEEKRTQIPFNQMPDSIKFATIALEDKDFYHHFGIKFSSIMRAALKGVVNLGVTQGGSTITQQFIKNSLLTSEKTFTRKIKEVILAIEIELKFSKDEILEMYLNEIPYGSNAYGIEAAAQTFFNKNAKDLTLDEATLLASLPKAPTYFSPYGSNIERLKSRQETALQKMTDLGYITQETADESKKIDVLDKIQPNRENIQAPHFTLFIKEYLEEKYGTEIVSEGGLSVYTTLDWEKQKIAEHAVQEGVENNLKRFNAQNAALVAIDPKTGQILSMVGSKNFFDTKIDGQVNVAIRERQPGSSFKPFVYLAAFIKGYTPETIVFDTETKFDAGAGKDYEPQNYDGKFNGPIKLKEALGRSLNIPAVKALYLVGVDNAITLAKNLGITGLNREKNYYGLSLVLGGGEVKLLDHVSAYATLANSGVRQQTTGILRIEDANKKILEQYEQKPGERVVEEKYIAMLDHILSTNTYRAPTFGDQNPLRFDDRPVAAKTGTTNEFRDGWTLGYTPSLAAGVWAGNNDNSKMTPGADGSYIASPIWRAFMEEALKNYTVENFPKYDPEDEENETKKDILDGKMEKEEGVKVCEIPGKKDKYCKSNKYCPKDEEKKRDFINAHTILYFVDRDDPRGEKPKDPEKDPQYKSWEKGVEKWYDDKKDLVLGEVPDECEKDDFKEFQPEIKISVSSSGKTLEISADAKAPYGVRKVSFYVDGEKIGESSSSSSKKTYAVPDSKNGKSLTIRIEVEDNIGNTNSDEEKKSISF